MILLDIKEVYTAINSDQRVRQLVKTAPLNIITANIIYWIILAVRFQMGVHIGTFGGDLSQLHCKQPCCSTPFTLPRSGLAVKRITKGEPRSNRLSKI